MKTPVGLRYGKMHFCLIENQIQGKLDLLGHSEPFDGAADNDGNCKINGRIITLMRTINYTAVGKFTQNDINLSLKGERHVFKITGTVIPKSEVKI